MRQNLKRTLSILLGLMLLLGLLPVTAITATADGAGTTIIEISSAADLKKIGTDSGYPLNGNYRMTGNIDLGGSASNQWTPIGSYNKRFTGTFDGRGFAVSGLFIDGNHCAGLFGYIGAGGVVKNLSVSGEKVKSGDRDDMAGSIAGRNDGTVENCHNTGCAVSADDVFKNWSAIGGVVGNNTGTVRYCSNNGAVTGLEQDHAGGIVGDNRGTVQHCSNAASVTGVGAGGIVGENTSGKVFCCYNTGNVTGQSFSNAGGVVGFNTGDSAEIRDCYNTGAVSNNDDGLDPRISTCVGGVVGCIDLGATLSNCYSIGQVSGKQNMFIGGAVGKKDDSSGPVTGCFCLEGTAEKVYGNTDSADGASYLDPDGFKDQANFKNGNDTWDFTDIWLMGADRPLLRPAGPNQYTVVYDPGDGGSGTMASTDVFDGDEFIFPACAFTAPEHKTFDHWTMSGVDGVFSPNSEVEIGSNCAINGVITVTACWKDAPAATVTTAPEARDPVYTGEAQELVTAGAATGGTMVYAIGTDGTTAPDSGWSADIPKETDAVTYYVWYKAVGDETHSDSKAKCVTVTIKKAAQAAPAAPTAESVTENSVTLKKTAGYQYSMDGTTWQDSNEFTGLTKDTEYTFYQRIAGDANHEPSPASKGMAIRTKNIVYSVVEGKDTEDGGSGLTPKHTIGSGGHAVYTVKRNEDDDLTFPNYTGVKVDGKAVPEGGSAAEKGSLILTLRSAYLDTLSEGEHKVKITFTDGSADAKLIIKPAAEPKPVPKTGDSGNPALWIGLVLIGIAALAVLTAKKAIRKSR